MSTDTLYATRDEMVASQSFAGRPLPDLLTELQTLYLEDERPWVIRSEEHTSELQSRPHLVCRLLLEKKNTGSARAASRCSGSCCAACSAHRFRACPSTLPGAAALRCRRRSRRRRDAR